MLNQEIEQITYINLHLMSYTDQIEIVVATEEEVNTVIDSIKNNKSPGKSSKH